MSIPLDHLPAIEQSVLYSKRLKPTSSEASNGRIDSHGGLNLVPRRINTSDTESRRKAVQESCMRGTDASDDDWNMVTRKNAKKARFERRTPLH